MGMYSLAAMTPQLCSDCPKRLCKNRVRVDDRVGVIRSDAYMLKEYR